MSECDLLDVANVGKIQDEGYLVLLYPERESLVRGVSSNVCEASFASCASKNDPSLFVNTPVSACFSELVSDRMSALLEGHLSTHCRFTCDVSGERFFMTVVTTRNGPLFEIMSDEHDAKDDMLSQCKLMSRLMAQHSDCQSLFETACSIVTEFVDYDRCMVYQFQPDLSGKVVYERIRPAMAGSIEPWIDIHFPGSDIPLPARQMYLIRPLRVIFDNDKAPVEVIGLPQNGHTDLSKCVLRASHPVHASYLKNMGVRSSMSIAIVIDSELWGLVCFHAYGEARHPRGWETSFFESLSVPVSANLARMHRDAYELRRDSLSRVVDKGFSCTGVLEFFRNHAIELLGVMEADCVSIFCADRVHSWGDPGLAMTDDSLKRVLRHSDGQECVIGKLSEPRRGVLCIKNPGLVVAFARRSVVLDKVWGGDPFHVKIMRPDGVPGPRGSFERYVQSDADSLNRWSAQDQHLAAYLSSRIKLVSTTLDSLSNKMKLVGKSDTAVRPGQVGYSTVRNDRADKTPKLDAALVSHFSHEMKTPIHGLSSILTLLLEDPDITPRGMRQKLLYGMECVKEVSTVVEDVLCVAGGHPERRGATKWRYTERVCLHEVVDALRKKYGQNESFTASTSVPKELGEIMINREGLNDALYAVIKNALTTTEEVHLSIKCHATHREAIMEWNDDTAGYSHRNVRNSEYTDVVGESDCWYTFSVRDGGCGVHSDMINNVISFGDESRESTTLAHSHQGTGVALYKCVSNVIFHMNGSLGIASTPSEGTTISLMIPAARVQQNKPPGNGAGGTFFVVDDNTVNRKLAARMVTVACMKTLGVVPEIREFSDGRLCVLEAERMKQKGEKILGVLLDHHMPVMTGKEAAKRIRQMEAQDNTPAIPIFGFTADSTDDTREALLEAGVNDILPKPLPMPLLEQACARIGAAKWS